MVVQLNVAVQNTVSTCIVLCSWMFVLRCLDVSLLTHTIHQTEIPAVVYSWLQTHLLSTKYAWSTRIAPVVSVSYKSVAVVTTVAVCLLLPLTSANVQTFSDLRRLSLRFCLPDDGVWLYASVCHCMLLYVSLCYCMLLYATVCHCMLLHATVCCCMLLYAAVCYCMLLYAAVGHCMLLCGSMCHSVLLFATVFCCELWQCISNCSCCMLLPICASSILRWCNWPFFVKVSLKINCIQVTYLSGEAQPVSYYWNKLRSAVT